MARNPKPLTAPVQLALPVTIRQRGAVSKAQGNQLSVLDWDYVLADMAREKHPTCSWWHGYRSTPHGFGAVCYVCDHLIATWSQRWDMTKRAKELVERHRATHWAEAMEYRAAKSTEGDS